MLKKFSKYANKMYNTRIEKEKQKQERLGEEKPNNQGSIMKIIEYRNSNDIDIEFLDDFHYRVYGTRYRYFTIGNIKNPYYPTVCGVGITGVRYPVRINGIPTKEYNTWHHMIQRCFDKNMQEKSPTYKDVTCCKEWLLFENFYDWLHSQENFNEWYMGDSSMWALDKDILVKGNKTYSPETCCLVPQNVNTMFVKNNANRGELPIGVCKDKNTGKYASMCMNPITGKSEWFGRHDTPLKSFYKYKLGKENIIKQVAQIEYDNGNIAEKCYRAMINYEVDIND